MENKSKIFSMLGLARKAGKLVSGEFMTENSIKSGKARLVIISEEASDNTRKHFKDMCSYRNVPCVEFGTKEELGHYTGSEMRASLALTDQGFADAISRLFE